MNSTRPSVYDVAAAANISTASVSRYFRSPDKLSTATRERIRVAVERLGYLPSGLARGLAERRTGMIGLYSFSGHEPDELVRAPQGAVGKVHRITETGTAPRLYPLFADEVLRGVELECTLRRVPLVIGWQDSLAGGVNLDDIAQRCDGLIVLPSTAEDAQLARLARRMPVVFLSQRAPDAVAAVSIRVDDEGGMRELVSHLADDHAARRFWYAGATEGAELEARFRGFSAALRERKLDVPESSLFPSGARAGSRDALLQLVDQRPELLDSLPDAIVCASDQTALGVLAALHELGLRVPEDLAVTGFDGIDAGRFAEPALTTIRQPMDELGREAVSVLTDELTAGQADAGERTTEPFGAEDVVLSVTLVIRRSCGCE